MRRLDSWPCLLLLALGSQLVLLSGCESAPEPTVSTAGPAREQAATNVSGPAASDPPGHASQTTPRRESQQAPPSAAPADHHPSETRPTNPCEPSGDTPECVVHTLEGEVRQAADREALITAYEALGEDAKALEEMQRFVEAYPRDRRGNRYRARLMASGVD